MNYSKYATKLLTAAAFLYMFEKLINTIPYYIKVTTGNYSHSLPEVSVSENGFIPLLVVIAFGLYFVDFYLKFKDKRFKNDNDKNNQHSD